MPSARGTIEPVRRADDVRADRLVRREHQRLAQHRRDGRPDRGRDPGLPASTRRPRARACRPAERRAAGRARACAAAGSTPVTSPSSSSTPSAAHAATSARDERVDADRRGARQVERADRRPPGPARSRAQLVGADGPVRPAARGGPGRGRGDERLLHARVRAREAQLAEHVVAAVAPGLGRQRRGPRGPARDRGEVVRAERRRPLRRVGGREDPAGGPRRAAAGRRPVDDADRGASRARSARAVASPITPAPTMSTSARTAADDGGPGPALRCSDVPPGLPCRRRGLPARGLSATFTFGTATLAPDGAVELPYDARRRAPVLRALDDPAGRRRARRRGARAALAPLLRLLHLVAGVSYYKAAAPEAVVVTGPAPGPAQARLLEALYSEGLGEFAFCNGLDALPRPAFPVGHRGARDGPRRARPGCSCRSAAGKDSVVAIEVARRAGADVTLFSVGNAMPIERTAAVAGLPRLIARRRLDPLIVRAQRGGRAQRARPGHRDRLVRGAADRRRERHRRRRDGERALRVVRQPHALRRRHQPPVQQGPGGRAAAARGARRDPAGHRRTSRCCGPPPSSASRAPSPRCPPTTARSRAATPSSASTRSCARRAGAATARSAASSASPWPRSSAAPS